jgi:hypothetical protein
MRLKQRSLSVKPSIDSFRNRSKKRAVAIDNLYAINKDRRNSLTGQSGNAVNAMLAAYDPFSNLSAVSLNHRNRIIEYFGFEDGPDFVTDTIGKKIVVSNAAILEGFRKAGITNNARTVSAFLHAGGIKELWTTEQEENEGPSTDSKAPAAEAGSETGDHALFYMESQLEDFLIENWDKTELGKRFDLIEEDGDLKSQQYRTGIGVIDILVQDKETKQLVVIELKKNQTSDDTVGQLARYMGWLQEHKTNGKPTKGIIIAARYDERLHYALKMLKDVEVYLYRVDFRLAEYSRPS